MARVRDARGPHGERRLLEFLEKHANERPQVIVDRLLKAVQAFRGGNLADDAVVAAFRARVRG